MTGREKKKMWILFLVLLIVAAIMQKNHEGRLKGNVVERNPVGEGDEEYCLYLDAEGIGEKIPYSFSIKEQCLSREEANSYMDLAIEEIEKDFAKMKNSVPIQSEYQDAFVEAEWHFEPEGLITDEGEIIRENIKEGGVFVEASVNLRCGEYEKTYRFPLRIPEQSLSSKERFWLELEQYIERENTKIGAKQLVLPEEIQGIPITWKEKKEKLIWKILGLELVVYFLVVISKKQKEKQKEQERVDGMEMDYPGIVSQITILLGAGMSISEVLNRIATHYLNKRQKKLIDEHEAYEELLYASRRISDGQSEREVLLVLQERLASLSYHKLIRMLLESKEKGMGQLCSSLEQETLQAYEQRILNVKKRAEEASTRMLVPLMIMMILVMAILITPAIIGFTI